MSAYKYYFNYISQWQIGTIEPALITDIATRKQQRKTNAMLSLHKGAFFNGRLVMSARAPRPSAPVAPDETTEHKSWRPRKSFILSNVLRK